MAKRKKTHKRSPSPAVTLSQCMIVKDEEKNIEKALSWGRDIVCEQIVVDTGSSDRTVEIAERMGAKVYHFEWINDFSAAKNFAIEKAKGNWIAFLDADEYIEEEDVRRVIPLLTLIGSDLKTRKAYMAVCCPWVQLNDEGIPKDILDQERIFRNLPSVRYIRRIHEGLTLELKDVVYTTDFRIMHTGYTAESFKRTSKADRNIQLLRAELEKNPDDMNTKAYIAESLIADAVTEMAKEGKNESGQYEDHRFIEAERLYREVLSSDADIAALHKKTAYEHFFHKFSNATSADEQIFAWSEKAYREFPRDHTLGCYYAMYLNKKGDFRAAFDVLKRCEAGLDAAMGSSSPLTTKVMKLLTVQMVLAAQGLGDSKTVLDYAEIILLMDKSNMGVLQPYLCTLISECSSIEEVLDRLGRVFDMSSKKDLLLIARAAKNVGAIPIARRIIDVVGYIGDE